MIEAFIFLVIVFFVWLIVPEPVETVLIVLFLGAIIGVAILAAKAFF